VTVVRPSVPVVRPSSMAPTNSSAITAASPAKASVEMRGLT
jgi:hypothetical protein